MRHSFRIWTALLGCHLLLGCNSEVFISPLRPSVTEATLDGDGDTLVIRFKESGWGLFGVHPTDEEMQNYPAHLYDLAGNDLGVVPCMLDDVGRLEIERTPSRLTIIRPNAKELKICVGDNLHDVPFRFSLYIDNNIERIRIPLTQPPCSGYAIDGITYQITEDSFLQSYIENQVCMHYIHTGSDELELSVILSQGIQRKLLFQSDHPSEYCPLKENATVEIPAADITQGVVLQGDRLPYTIQPQYIDVTLPQIEKKFTARPGDNVVRRFVEYDVYRLKYTLTAHNVRTGKPYTDTGTLTSYTPNGWIMGYVEHTSPVTLQP